MKNVNTFIEVELAKLGRGIVATPSEDYLDKFTDANQGSNDFLLMQMSKQYGYKLALLNIREQLNTK
tara:strand:- start:340 stop:540 length:201 start_codon:yes stop_codon:yes gene_type:complete